VKIKFPINNNKYYPLHFEYLKNIFLYMGTEIEYYNNDDFEIHINNKKYIVDYSDHSSVKEKNNCIKYHCYDTTSIPFCPVSFHDWKQYYSIRDKIKYKCNNELIIHKQRIYGSDDAKHRRTKVRNILLQKYKNINTVWNDPQIDFWNMINNCLVSVCVPGATPNMLDRGQLQYMALGCCTISPNIPEILPFNKILQADKHYLQCKNDYSDLINIIEWCKNNREKCVSIGSNAKEFFGKYLTPDKLMEWTNECICINTNI